jgi:hypothetical protein|tara:strand:+ start:476 stop:2002 length:1527 start_codon:yes stop_codon:yes gene_type:complete
MGISFWEGLGYVTQGAAEGSEKIRQEKLTQRMETLKEDKAMYQELAKTRYATDLGTYEAEAKNLAEMQKALKSIESANSGSGMDKRNAALAIIQASPKQFEMYKAHSDADKETMIQTVMQGFKDEFNAEGKKTGFRVSQPLETLTMPKEMDYFKGTEFWQEWSDEIQSGTEGPLSIAMKKLLRMKKADPASELNKSLNIKGTKIRGDIGIEDVVSKNTKEVDIGFKTGILKTNFNKNLDGIDSTFYDDAQSIRSKNILTKTQETENIMTVINTIAVNFDDSVTEWDRDTGTIVLNENGTLFYNQIKAIYSEVDNWYWGHSFYEDGELNGRDWSSGKFLDLFRKEVNNRTLKITGDTKAWFNIFTKEQIDNGFVLNTNALPVGVTLLPGEKTKIINDIGEFVSTDEFQAVTEGKSITESSLVETLIQQKAQKTITEILNERKEDTPVPKGAVANIMITEDLITEMMEENNKTRDEVIKSLEENPIIGDYNFIFPHDFQKVIQPNTAAGQ